MTRIQRLYGGYLMDLETGYFSFCPSLNEKKVIGFLFPNYAELTISLDSGQTIAFKRRKGASNTLVPPNKRIFKWVQSQDAKIVRGAIKNVAPLTQNISVYILLKDE